MKPRILLVEDEPAIKFGFSDYLGQSGYEVACAPDLAAARAQLAEGRFDVILLDLNLPDGSGMSLIPEARLAAPEVSLVVITGVGDIPVAVEAMQKGADNFLTKPVNMVELEVYLKKCLELKTLRRSDLNRKRLDAAPEPFFGRSLPMQRVVELAGMAAERDSPVILQGETGSGKGVLARWIHDRSARRAGSFVEVNCSMLKGDLLQSELFGHARGAFTSAAGEKPGLIEIADGGTLFLDEISDMEVGVQAQLLKVIEEKRYRRMGEVRTRQSDFRLICATHRDLHDDTKHGRFRLDLYYRINVLGIDLPPLRLRTDDLEGLIKHLLQSLNAPDHTVAPDGLQRLQAYHWPGNIRELRNVLERAVILSTDRILTGSFLPLPLTAAAGAAAAPGSLREIERSQVLNALEQSKGDTIAASRALGITRSALYRKMKKYKIPAGNGNHGTA